MKNCLSLFFSLIITINMPAQDFLVLKDGRTVSCKITGTDSAYVYIDIIDKNLKKKHTLVSKNDIQDIRYKPVVESSEKIRINSFGISAGVNLPTGKFASDDLNSKAAGFAGKGISINAVYVHYLVSYFGLLVKGYYNTNRFEVSKLRDMMSSQLGLPFDYNTVNYHSFGFFAGPVVLIQVDRLSVTGHFLWGHANLNQPEVTFTTASINGYGWIKLSDVSKGSSIINAGGSLVYSVNKHWNIIANMDYMQALFKFDTYTISGSSGHRDEIERGDQKYSVISISAGLELKF